MREKRTAIGRGTGCRRGAAARLLALGLFLLSHLAAPLGASEKSDVVHLRNGDRVTGEIQKLEQNRLRLSTDAMGTIEIQWDDVASVSSSSRFQLEIETGERFFGSVEPGPEEHTLRVVSPTGQTDELPFTEVVLIRAVEETFWNRLEGSLSLGYNFTRASRISQVSLSSSMRYRTRKRTSSLSASYISTADRDEGGVSRRSDLAASVTRLRQRRWFNQWMAGIESNDELGLDARFGLGAGIGRFLVRNRTSELSLLTGLFTSYENLTGAAASESGLEAILGSSYSRYLDDDPQVEIEISLMLFPALDGGGRLRGDLDLSLRYELLKDLFLDFSFYDNYDSDPPSGDEFPTNDFGVLTSLGWSF